MSKSEVLYLTPEEACFLHDAVEVISRQNAGAPIHIAEIQLNIRKKLANLQSVKEGLKRIAAEAKAKEPKKGA
jgi:hypothetical protein